MRFTFPQERVLRTEYWGRGSGIPARSVSSVTESGEFRHCGCSFYGSILIHPPEIRLRLHVAHPRGAGGEECR